MKKQVFVIHGGNSFSKHENFLKYLANAPLRDLPGSEAVSYWKTTLAEDLGADYEVFMPVMPNKQNALYAEWKIWFERHFEYLRDEVTLVGWSLGGMFLVKYLSENELPIKIKALHLLAAPGAIFADEAGDDCGSFHFDPKNLEYMVRQTPKIGIWHSTDDMIVPYEHALWYQKSLPKAELFTFSDRNHFLIPDFPELLTKIKKG